MTTKPWADDAFELDDDEYEALWDNVKPEEFYFSIDSGTLCMSPIEYTDNNGGAMFDQPLLIDNLLPEGLDQEMEATFVNETGMSDEELKQDLINRGFVFKADLVQF